MTKMNNALTMEEMELVAGGKNPETSNDSRFLNVLLRGRSGQCDRYGTFTSGSHHGEIAQAWASVGIRADFREGRGRASYNVYYLGDKQISRDEAWAHAEQVVGKHLQRKDWDW